MAKAKETKNAFTYTEEVTGEIVNIPIKLLHHHHNNPRKEYGDLTELADSIKQNGVFQNLTVVPYWFEQTGVGCDFPEQQAEMGYLVVIGNRRLEAAKIAGLETLPCIISGMSHKEQLSTMLVENMQRCDLTVYEQAQGFQMMLDLGESVESIAKKSGFSQSTVRRRVKLAELDQNKLKEVSSRQISMSDFEKLNKIKDINKRNKALEKIGTPEFNNEVKKIADEEKRKERENLWREKLLSLGLEEIKHTERYDSKYASCNRVWLSIYANPEEFTVDDQEYFSIDKYNTVYFYKTASKARPEKEDPSVIAARENENKRRLQIDELNKRFYELRKEFCDSVPVMALKKHTAEIFSFLMLDIIENNAYIAEDDFAEAFNYEPRIDENGDEYIDYEDLLEFVKSSEEKSLWKMLLLQFDDENRKSFNGWRYEYEFNRELDRFYKLITELGYEMSEEEKQWADGTHPLYQTGE